MDPALKSRINMIFRDLIVCRPKTIGMGRINTMISVIILSTAVAMYNDALFKHRPPLTVTSVFLENGVQAASREMIMPTQDPITTNMVR